LINRSTPKPLAILNLVRDAIEPKGELEPNRKLLSVHAPFILHDAMVGVFSPIQSQCETNVFIEALYWKPNAIAIFPLL